MFQKRSGLATSAISKSRGSLASRSLMIDQNLSIHACCKRRGFLGVKNISCRIWVACAAGVFANDHRSSLAMDKPGTQNRILLVHGIGDSAASMQMLRARLARDGRQAFAISLQPGDGKISLRALSLQLRDYVGTHFPAMERFDLVGFSMGGLVCRYYVQMLGGSSRVDRLTTVSAPNYGTLLAYLSSRDACKEMRPDSEFLRKLNEDYSTLGNLNVTSFWTPLDLVIIPPKSSRMPIGINKPIPVLAHPLMILQRRALDEVANALSHPLRRRTDRQLASTFRSQERKNCRPSR
jgi:triacylglycerol lipase